MACTFLYATPFVPRFWDALCTCAEPAQYTVVQDIVRAPADAGAGASPSAPSPAAEEDGEVLLTVVYRFDGQGQGQGVATGTATPGASPPLSPASFDSESSHELGSDYGDLLMYSGLAAQQQPGPAALAPSLSTQSLPSLASMPALAPQAHPSPPPPHSPGHLAHAHSHAHLHTHSPGHLAHAHSPAHAQAHLHAHHGAGTDAYASLPPSPLEQLSFGAHAHAYAPQQQAQQQQQQGVPSVFDAPQYSGFDGAGAYGMKFPSL
ncbi:hypothetical protein WOLCODRAFT_28132 [Wolfiporia cocos MD-104 SS10]|uniref:Uncharacterized protein n=1 Tax=Wolfiporia cocos (strain MD-104) TaxID=742152 RepID=A0A2H3J269_WOLCO|nr:hypothetical protein WOLCODRAFT_28132 [Wolfiporia cocos MD-104 SS10]